MFAESIPLSFGMLAKLAYKLVIVVCILSHNNITFPVIAYNLIFYSFSPKSAIRRLGCLY